jgi:hypothetical protein
LKEPLDRPDLKDQQGNPQLQQYTRNDQSIIDALFIVRKQKGDPQYQDNADNSLKSFHPKLWFGEGKDRDF